MKCSICAAEAHYSNRFAAAHQGWRFIESLGPNGWKYGCYCPTESKRDIVQAIAKTLESEALQPTSKGKA